MLILRFLKQYEFETVILLKVTLIIPYALTENGLFQNATVPY